MAQPLLIAHPENATIVELKQVSPLSSNETATRCSAIQNIRKYECHAKYSEALLVGQEKKESQYVVIIGKHFVISNLEPFFLSIASIF